MTTHQITIARATDDEIDELRQFFSDLDQWIEDDNGDDETLALLDTRLQGIRGSVERVLLGYQCLVDNFCNKSVGYLAKKEATAE